MKRVFVPYLRGMSYRFLQLDFPWSSDSTIPVGAMHLNSVGQMLRLENASGEGTHVQPSLWDLDIDNEISGVYIKILLFYLVLTILCI